jgi:hypothetical protein
MPSRRRCDSPPAGPEPHHEPQHPSHLDRGPKRRRRFCHAGPGGRMLVLGTTSIPTTRGPVRVRRALPTQWRARALRGYCRARTPDELAKRRWAGLTSRPPRAARCCPTRRYCPAPVGDRSRSRPSRRHLRVVQCQARLTVWPSSNVRLVERLVLRHGRHRHRDLRRRRRPDQGI